MNATPSTSEQERRLAILGLALDSGEVLGNPPSLAEIDQWRRGELPEPRAAEVRSHLLRSPDLFRQLRRLEQDEVLLADLKSELRKARQTALLGLALDAQIPPGVEPDLAEIDQWRRGELREPRASEVRHHLMHNPHLLAQWKQLEHEEQELEAYREQQSVQPAVTENKTSRRMLSDWLRQLSKILLGGGGYGFGGALATGMTILFLAVFGLRLYLDPSLMEQIERGYGQWDDAYPVDNAQWHWQRPQQTKSLDFWQDPVPPDREKLAFSVGVHQGLLRLTGDDPQWQRIAEGFPKTLPDCAGQDRAKSCSESIELMRMVGNWAALVQLQCSHDRQTAEPFWQEQKALRQQFQERLAAISTGAAPFADYLARWPRGQDDRDSLCAGIPSLLDLGLIYR